MTVLDNLISNIDKVAYNSIFGIDNAIATLEGTIASPAPGVGSFTLTAQTSPTGFNKTCYFKGIFSFDGGTTWNDFGAMTPDLSTPSMPVLQTLQAVGAVEQDGDLRVSVINYYDNVHGVGNAYTVLWKAVLFAKNDQGTLTPLPIGSNTQLTSIERDYQKIFMQDEIAYDITSGVGKTETITHGLGYIPKVRAFYQATDGTQLMLDPWLAFKIETRITETTLSFVLQSTLSAETRTGFMEYRIYYQDAS